MPIGTIALETAKVGQPLASVFKDHLRFTAPDDYVQGTGVTGFAAQVATGLGKEGVDIIGVSVAGACGGYIPIYDKENDTLFLYITPASGPLVEAGSGDYQAVTLDLWVEYQ